MKRDTKLLIIVTVLVIIATILVMIAIILTYNRKNNISHSDTFTSSVENNNDMSEVKETAVQGIIVTDNQPPNAVNENLVQEENTVQNNTTNTYINEEDNLRTDEEIKSEIGREFIGFENSSLDLEKYKPLIVNYMFENGLEGSTITFVNDIDNTTTIDFGNTEYYLLIIYKEESYLIQKIVR